MLSTQFCPTCGAANEAAQARCFACGQTLSTGTDVPAAADTPLLHERYRLGVILGSGGFSTVYRARDVQAGRDVAIKRISLRGLSAEEVIEATDTFNREASALSALRHPQIPQIYDQFSDQEHWYLVLQYLEGPTLESYLETRATQGKPLQFDEVLEMALQLGEVLNYLHTRQPPVIFRDLKPGNIIRTFPKGTLCLIDFGIARRFRPGQKRDTQTLGSPGYAAPEQYGRAQTTPRSDIYSLGALLHQMLSGDDPTESPPGLKPLHLHSRPGEERLGELVQRMLSPDPEQRPGNMDEVIAELKAIQPQRSPQLVTHVWQPAPQNQPSASPGWQQWQQQVQVQAPSSPSAPASPGRRKVLIGLGGALAVIGVGGGAWLIMHPRLINPAGQKVCIYRGHTDSVTSVIWSPNSKYVASASKDKTVQIWNATTGKASLAYRGHTDAVNAVAWSPNGQHIASCSNDKTVQVWDAITGKTLLTYRGHTGEVTSVAWSPDSKRIVSCSGTAHVWDATTGKTLLTYQAPSTDQEQQGVSSNNNNMTSTVDSVAWSPSGLYIASISFFLGPSSDGMIQSGSMVQVWNATSGMTAWNSSGGGLDIMDSVNPVAWSPDSQLIAFGSDDGTMQVWDATSGWTTSTHENFSEPMLDVTSVTWSPDGQYVASGANDKTVQVWFATSEDSSTVLTYQGHTATVNAVAWSPNGQYITSGSDDKTVQVWVAP